MLPIRNTDHGNACNYLRNSPFGPSNLHILDHEHARGFHLSILSFFYRVHVFFNFIGLFLLLGINLKTCHLWAKIL